MKLKPTFIPLLAICVAAAIMAAGCSSVPEKEVVQLNRNAANILARQLLQNPQSSVSHATPILVTTIADVDRLDTSSAMGRITAEEIAANLARLGFNVSEVKSRGNLFVQRERGEFKNLGSPYGGEFVLSRDMEKIAADHNATTIIAGTYAVGRTHSIISLRAIDVGTKRIIAGYDYAVPAVPWQWINPMPEEKKK